MKLISDKLAESAQKAIIQAKKFPHDLLSTSVDLDKLEKQLQNKELVLPDDAIQQSMRLTLERDFLNYLDPLTKFHSIKPLQNEQGWVRIRRLPISPIESKTYALYPRWQNSLSTLHALNQRLCYVLLRNDGITKLFLGSIPCKTGLSGDTVISQLRQAVSSQMPGISVEPVLNEQGRNNIFNEFRPLLMFDSCGAVTGLPSLRKMTEYGEYQTMDQIAMGIRDENEDKNFAVVITADPISDSRITDILRTMENLGSEIHALTQYTKTDGKADNTNICISYTDGASGGIGVGLGQIINANIGLFLATTNTASKGINSSESISQQYINKSAMYCEELFDRHIARMKAGRNLGFWKTGIYVLAQEQSTVNIVMGMLRAAYSGDDTYVEPIRITLMPNNSGADTYIKMFQHIPYPQTEIAGVLGDIFQDFATPMTTEELSIATSLPRRDVPGLRLIRNATRFAMNPPELKEKNCRPIDLGEVMDTGSRTGQKYQLDMNQFVKHALVAGTNGSGKSNTCKYLLSKVLETNTPFLVIEPAKDEYIRWAIDQNKYLSEKKQILIFAPGLLSYDGQLLQQLRINPFQPFAAPGKPLNMLGHLDRLKSALLNSIPMSDVLPLIIEETIYAHVNNMMDIENYRLSDDIKNVLDGPILDNGTIQYPFIRDMIETANFIIGTRQYDQDVTKNIKAAVQTRISTLLLGWKKSLFNVPRSTDFGELFESKNVVINLSHLPDNRDKALVMSLIHIALWEYRESRYNTDNTYRWKADNDELMHLTLVEEAHRLLSNISSNGNDLNGAQTTAAHMFSEMLSEVRAYGEGCVIVDQVPTRLIPDAIKNTNLKIIHRLNASDDIKAISTSMSLQPDQESVIGALQPGEVIVCSEFDDSAAWVKVPKLAKTMGIAKEIKRGNWM